MVRKYFRGISLKNEQNLINNWICEKERKMSVFHADDNSYEYRKSITVIHHINRIEDKNHMIISIDMEKHCTKSNNVSLNKRTSSPE